MRLGLRAQLLLALFVVTVGAIASVGVIAILETRQALALDRVSRAAVWAEAAGRTVETALDPGHAIGDAENRAKLTAVSASIVRATDASELVVYDERGQPLLPGAAAKLDIDAIGLSAALAGAPPHAEDRPGGEAAPLVAYAPVRSGAARGALRMGFPVDKSVDALLARARASVLFLGAVDALLLLLVGA